MKKNIVGGIIIVLFVLACFNCGDFVDVQAAQDLGIVEKTVIGSNFMGGQDLLGRRVEATGRIKGIIKMISVSKNSGIAFLILCDNGEFKELWATNCKLVQ